jgi:hypothetical protein
MYWYGGGYRLFKAIKTKSGLPFLSNRLPASAASPVGPTTHQAVVIVTFFSVQLSEES